MRIRFLGLFVAALLASSLRAPIAQAMTMPPDPPGALRTAAGILTAASLSAAGQAPAREGLPDLPSWAASTAVSYTVRQGDTLFGIGMRYGLSEDVIVAANHLGPSPVLSPGEKLLLPWTNPVGTARVGPEGPIVTGPGLHFVASTLQQTCWLLQGGQILDRWPCSTGRSYSPSALGNYTVQSKLWRGYFIGADSWMPDWLGLYDAGGQENGIHGLPYAADTGEKFWTDKVGTPVTWGCIMLEDAAAEKLFAMAYVGMPVTILR